MTSVSPSPRAPVLLWFRQDLRLADNPALSAAVREGTPIVPVFIWAPDEEGEWPPGAASRWWLLHSLGSLDRELRQAGSRLILRRGPSGQTLLQLISETKAMGVFWNRRYEPAIRKRDQQIDALLESQGVLRRHFNSALLHEPAEIANRSGKPFRVFTPFWRHCLCLPEPPEPLPQPVKLTPPKCWPTSASIDSLGLAPRPDWAAGLRAAWQPGTPGALARLDGFLTRGYEAYASARDRPDLAGTSRLSAHLHFGEISPRQVWHTVKRHAVEQRWRQSTFIAELGWREFAHHLLYHFPHTETRPLRPEFGRVRWRDDGATLELWQKGQTGYPIVDAGMRELWTTGWMHNRTRMIVASFLVKDLLTSWQHGARWFWDTLVDADLAQNTLGWQWTSGCGADAAPFFRIFNPVSQGGSFDPQGAYVRRWVPELGRLPSKWIHRPHEAPADVLEQAGIVRGRTYPLPLVNHQAARELALAAYAAGRSTPPAERG